MNTARHPDSAFLESLGIYLPELIGYYKPNISRNLKMAMDAQPALVTVSDAGIPAYLANYIDPKMVEVLVAPLKAAEIATERQFGDWTTLTATFPVIENTGQVASYGDWSQNGSVNANPSFPVRQSYHYQTMTNWGERQLAMAALAKIDWASRLNIASVDVLNQFQNNTYFYGVLGLQNYGLLNDPSLPAALTPGVKTAGGNAWVNGAGIIVATANEIYADIQSAFIQLSTQSQGWLEADMNYVLALSPRSATAMTATNSFNVSVSDLLKKNFPNLKIVTAPQYATAAGQLFQLWAVEVRGQKVVEVAYTEKLRAHPIIRQNSAFTQKKSQGTLGSVIYYPWAVSQMIGI